MVFYAYDLYDYINERDFYYPYREFVPGPVAADTAGLVRTIRDMESGFSRSSVRLFKERFMGACDGRSSERIADVLFGTVRNGRKMPSPLYTGGRQGQSPIGLKKL